MCESIQTPRRRHAECSTKVVPPHLVRIDLTPTDRSYQFRAGVDRWITITVPTIGDLYEFRCSVHAGDVHPLDVQQAVEFVRDNELQLHRLRDHEMEQAEFAKQKEAH